MNSEATVTQKIQAIHKLIRAEGKANPTAGADRYELQDIASLVTDAGYGIKIVAKDLSVWADLGSNQHGFMRGDETDLDAVLEELKITL